MSSDNYVDPSLLPAHTKNQADARTDFVRQDVRVKGEVVTLELEADLWLAIDEIMFRENNTIHELCDAIARTKPSSLPLAAAVRTFLVDYFRAAATEEGHLRSRHGNFHVHLPFTVH